MDNDISNGSASVAEPNRDKVLRFRVTDEEKRGIEAKAKAAGCKQVSDYLRKVGLHSQIKEALPSELRRQLVGLGTNLNQIARLNNSGKLFPQHEKQLLEAINLIRKYLV